jgi:large subunit ribosomal protein L6
MKTTQFEGKFITIPVKLLDLLKIKKVILLASNQLTTLIEPTNPRVDSNNSRRELEVNYHQKLIITGPLGEQSIVIPKNINLEIEKNTIKLSEIKDSIVVSTSKKNDINQLINLNYSLINQMILGVTEGFKKQIKLIGIGYKVNLNSTLVHSSSVVEGLSLTLNIGFSHPVTIHIPKNIKISEEAIKENKTDQSSLILNSTSLIDLNNFVYSIKRIRPVEKSFKGTGITIVTP